MRLFLSILVLIFSFQSFTKASDVSVLEIEGISVGDSLLDYFDETTIINNIRKDYVYKDDSFYDVEIMDKSFELYEGISLSLKKNDKSYLVYQITGFNFYERKVEECFNKVEEVSNKISNLLENLHKVESEKPHSDDPTGNSHTKQVIFWHNSGSIFTECYDWSDKITKEKGWTDNFSVGVALEEYDLWLNNKAY